MHDPAAGLAASRQFGPWALNLDPGERVARLRSLRAIVRLLLGPRGAALAGLLLAAETDVDALVPAADALDAMASLDMRKVLASYAGLARPLPPARRGEHRGTFVRPVMGVTPRHADLRRGWRVKILADQSVTSRMSE